MEQKGMKNKYLCDVCMESIITINRDDGTTAFIIKCCATPGCRGTMISQSYNVDQKAEPAYEWYRPHEMAVLPAQIWDHVKLGGLCIRPITLSVVIKWFFDSPDAGNPDCICSFCGRPISDEQGPAVRLFDTDTKMEARFHMDNCWTEFQKQTQE